MERTEVIRPAAVLPEEAAMKILAALRAADVSRGGVWNASSSLWQRYDRPWDVLTGLRGDAELIGTICVTYDMPSRYYITVYRVTVTEVGLDQGWSVAKLCDDAFGFGGLTLDSCPRADLVSPVRVDPFKTPREAVSGLPAQRTSVFAEHGQSVIIPPR